LFLVIHEHKKEFSLELSFSTLKGEMNIEKIPKKTCFELPINFHHWEKKKTEALNRSFRQGSQTQIIDGTCREIYLPSGAKDPELYNIHP
jgi:hypothetical protein